MLIVGLESQSPTIVQNHLINWNRWSWLLDANRSDAGIYFRGEHKNEWEFRPSVMQRLEPGDATC